MTKPLPLTDENLPKFKLTGDETDRTFWDIPAKRLDPVTGFGLRLRAGGSRVYVLRYKYQGQTRRVMLGEAGLFKTVKDAREKARKTKDTVLSEINASIDPKIAKQHRDEEADRKRSAAEAGAFVQLAKQYVEYKTTDPRNAVRPKTLYEIKRYLIGLDNAAPAVWHTLHSLTLPQITRTVVESRLQTVAEESGTTTADRARVALSGFFVWAIRKHHTEINPVLDIEPATAPEDTKRDRVLSDAELRAIWNALPTGDYGDIVRLLILTGQRSNEIAGITWGELAIGPETAAAKRLIALPADRTKNGLPHDVPLSVASAAILEVRPRIAGRDYVFGEGKRGYQGWSKSKAALDEKLGFNEPWQLRDIRRTVVTGMSELGILPHVVEAVVNHVSGDAKRGVAGVYNKAKYNPEKRAALNCWAEQVAKLVSTGA